ncbi:enoyl-CoA hydratase-related protein [Escherichia marmotae]|uniref:enoyl-CoA hydratase/isomerase family protein n=1 Tax=Escherichia marmotae TaxID=1499973 RepID=UPI0022798676|nr:enoyl-CoA hydratase-related protein [Escherichia marmotae]MEC9832317.1 enoyl-CoA hydratase-related protein [Escherichia marmotae]MED8862498.1 enoyl-CoA hydratase-related protein [Escherichia marmotae]MED9033057.1 enoyl-CoA hydratase-related protein [Escherichia marmotae]MED9044338.1 enoyl-CoA hydratase-related protein [Escherichia marmotae]MED9051818.1 enoyl-CoA hydratase-related protein [Escherichia marmotae]
MVNRVVAREALHDAGQQLAQRIAQRAPIAVQLAKQVIDAGEGIAVASTLEALAGAFSSTTQDAREGSQAFAEKRQPNFSAR